MLPSHQQVHDYGPECVLPVPSGTLRSPAFPDECDYVRVCDHDGREIAYWIADEWREAPEEVMGAIIGSAMGVPQ